MRVLVFFDLPVTTSAGRRAYTAFRKFLIKDGFFMMQESVYCKIALNQQSSNAIVEQIKSNKPDCGLVQVLVITEKQYSNIVQVVGDNKTDIINSSERLVVL